MHEGLTREQIDGLKKALRAWQYELQAPNKQGGDRRALE